MGGIFKGFYLKYVNIEILAGRERTSQTRLHQLKDFF